MNANPPRQGAIGVVVREGLFLVVERSQHVRAPGMLCFPGGGIEPGETEEQAVVRELREEIGARVESTRRLWQSTTAWKTPLTWFQCAIDPNGEFVLDTYEVAAVLWMSADQLRNDPRVLSSNIAFLDAWETGVFEIEQNT